MDTEERAAGPEGRRDAYMAKAEEADYQAVEAKDPMAKTTWESIAGAYRELARLALGSQL